MFRTRWRRTLSPGLSIRDPKNKKESKHWCGQLLYHMQVKMSRCIWRFSPGQSDWVFRCILNVSVRWWWEWFWLAGGLHVIIWKKSMWKTAMIIFPSLILFTNLKYTGHGKVIKWLKMWLNWPNTFWGHFTYLSKENNNNKCMYTDWSGVLEGLESSCGGRKNSDMLSRNRIKPRLKQVRSTVVKSGLKKSLDVISTQLSTLKWSL